MHLFTCKQFVSLSYQNNLINHKNMAKRTITITSQVEVDVEFPIYTRVKNGSKTFCYFRTENEGIWISNYEFQCSITRGQVPMDWISEDVITKEEFEAEFKKVQDKIYQLL